MSQYEHSDTALRLGFLPLMDSAPLIIARELGFFEEQGLNVILLREGSWSSIRDKVSWGLLDGASMLAPMPLASTLGLNAPSCPMIAAMTLSRGGNAITLSKNLVNTLTKSPTKHALSALVDSMDRPLKLASVYHYSCHQYQLMNWLEDQHITPDQVQFSVVPPSRMPELLATGELDGYCAGEPWNTIAQQKDVGRIVASGISLRPHSCEKVFTVTQKWALSHRAQLASLIIALQQACHWLSNPENTQQMIDILSLPPYLDRHIADLHPVQLTPLLPLFNHSNQPVVDEAEYLLEQMNHWGQVKPEQASAVASEVFATEIYNEAMTELSTPLEINDAK